LIPSIQYDLRIASVCCGDDTTSFVADSFWTIGSICPAITGLHVAPQGREALLTWDPALGASAYLIYFYPSDTATAWTYKVDGQDSTFLLTGLDPCSTFRVELAAICDPADLSEWTYSGSFTAHDCSAPANPIVANLSDVAALFLFNASRTLAEDWRVRYRPVGSSSWDTLAVTSDMHELDGLDPATQYEFMAQQLCCSGLYSNWSDADTFRTQPQLCPSPQLVSATLAGDSASILWQHVPAVSGYRVTLTAIGDSVLFFHSEDIAAPDTYSIIRSLDPCLIYMVEVASVCNDSLLSFVSTQGILETNACEATAWIDVITRTDNALRIRWAPVPSTQSYSVRYRSLADTAWAMQTVSETEVWITGLSSNTQYAIEVHTNCCGNSSVGAAFSDTVVTRIAPCLAASWTEITPTATGLLLKWSNLGQAHRYIISWYPDSLPSVRQVVFVAGSDSLLELTGLPRCNDIRLELESMCPNGEAHTLLDTAIFNQWCPTPSFVISQFITDRTAKVFWEQTYANYYKLRYRALSDSAWTEVDSLIGGPYTLPDLASNTAYIVEVAPVCCPNNSLVYSRAVRFVTQPYPCESVIVDSIAFQGSSAFITWFASRHWQTDYIVEWQADTAGAPFQQQIISYPDTSARLLNLSTCHTYKIRILSLCMQSLGRPPVEIDLVLPSCLPVAAPVVESITNHSALVKWMNSAGAYNYEVSWHPVWSSSWQSAYTSADSLLLTGLIADTTYQVRVRAFCCSSDTSEWSTIVEFSTLPCDPPTGLIVDPITEHTLTLTWQPAAQAQSYSLRYRRLHTSTWTVVTGIADTTTVLTGLDSGTAYEIELLSACVGIDSPYGSRDTATTAGCGVPRDLTLSNSTVSGFTASWTAAATATSYRIEYRLLPSGSWTGIDVPATSTSITGLADGSAYEVRVRSTCGSITSAWSPLDTIQTLTCELPTGLSFSNITATAFTASWNAVAGATSYELRYRPGGPIWTTVTGLTSTTYTATGLTPNTFYQVQLRTVCGSLSTGWGSSGAVQTLATRENQPSLDQTLVPQLSIYPNPNRGQFSLNYRAPVAGPLRIEVFDVAGKRIFSQTFEAVQGNNEWPINLPVSSGLYLLEASWSTGQERFKLVIE
jgi:chitodextrinase